MSSINKNKDEGEEESSQNTPQAITITIMDTSSMDGTTFRAAGLGTTTLRPTIVSSRETQDAKEGSQSLLVVSGNDGSTVSVSQSARDLLQTVTETHMGSEELPVISNISSSEDVCDQSTIQIVTKTGNIEIERVDEAEESEGGVETSSYHCLICNEELQEEQIPVFKTLTTTSQRKVSVYIGILVGQKLTSRKVHSDIICPKCFSLLNRLDLLEIEIRDTKEELVNKYQETVAIHGGRARRRKPAAAKKSDYVFPKIEPDDEDQQAISLEMDETFEPKVDDILDEEHDRREDRDSQDEEWEPEYKRARAKREASETDPRGPPKRKRGRPRKDAAKSKNFVTAVASRLGKKLRSWSQTDMNKALQACREQGMKISEAAKRYSVPRRTLSDRINRVTSDDCQMGKSTALTKEQEADLASYIGQMANKGFPLSVDQITTYAWYMDRTSGQNAFGEKGPCYGWWVGFRNRHPETAGLTKHGKMSISSSVSSSVNGLRLYFQLFKKTLDDGGFLERPEDIYNCDEAIVDISKETKRVLLPRRLRRSFSKEGTPSEHFSILSCVSADGFSMPPCIVFKGMFPGGKYTDRGPDGTMYGQHEFGIVDSEIFLKWMLKIFLPYAKPTEERPVLILLDGNNYHRSVEVIEAAKRNNVILMAPAPYSTYLWQPLDIAIYKTLKVKLENLVKLGQSLRGNKWIIKRNIPKYIRQPYEESMSEANIKAGFKNCGVYPFCPNAIDKSRLLKKKIISEEDEDLSLVPTEGMVDVQSKTPYPGPIW